MTTSGITSDLVAPVTDFKPMVDSLKKTGSAERYRRRHCFGFLAVLRRISRWSVVVPNVITAISLAAMTAFGGLILEDLLSAKGSSGMQPLIISRWWWLGVSFLVLLIIGLVWARRIKSKRGSAYIVQVQDESAPRWHAGRIVEETASHLNRNTFIERFDPGDEIVVDLRNEVTALASEIQASQNGDDDTTCFSFYPDMVFPVGLALGYSWEPPAGTRLFEINGEGGRPDFSMKMRDLHAPKMIKGNGG
ncbi:MAG: hypothetical protein LBM23_02290, partial [Propionibacteriaceae bacterium]|nr:hypothetical protein [Propionibacteriaceae bacterium]